MNIAELRKQRGELVTRANEIIAGAEKEGRNLSGEEKANYDQIVIDAKALNERIGRAETVSELGGVETRSGVVTPQIDPVEMAINPNVYGTQEYRTAWKRWFVDGNAGLMPQEARALSTTNSAGGYLMTPTKIAEGLVAALDEEVYIRKLATKFLVPDAKSLGVPKIATDMEDATVTAEGSAADEDTALAFGQRELSPRGYTKYIPVSNKLLRAVPNAEDVVVDRMAESFGRTLEKEYMTGDGTGNCLGIFVASNDGIATGSDVLAAAATSVKIDDFIKLKFALPSRYWTRPSTRWVMHPDVAFQLAKEREGSGTGQYLWRESTRVGEPDTLLGIPVIVTPYAPNTLTANQYVAVLGDFSYYHIADALSLSMKRLEEINALKDETVFLGRLETDAAPVHTAAFRRLKLAAS